MGQGLDFTSGDQVQRPAQDPALVKMLEARDYQALAESPLPLGWRCRAACPPSSAGWCWTRPERSAPGGPRPPPDISRRTSRRGVHVSHAFEDEADGRAKFAFSTPMFGSEGTLVGVMVAMIATDSALLASDPGGTAALVGLRDLSQRPAVGPRASTSFSSTRDWSEAGW